MSDKAYEYVIDFLRDLQKQEFYGKIIIEIHKGKIVLLRKEQTIKPGEDAEHLNR